LRRFYIIIQTKIIHTVKDRDKMGYRANRKALTKEDKDRYALMVGKRVTVNSYLINGKTGIVTQHLRSANHFWITMDEPYRALLGGISKSHKCNCGNVQLVD